MDAPEITVEQTPEALANSLQELEKIITFNGKRVKLVELTLRQAFAIMDLFKTPAGVPTDATDLLKQVIEDKLFYKLMQLTYVYEDGSPLVIDENTDIDLEEAAKLLYVYIIKKNAPVNIFNQSWMMLQPSKK